MCIYVYTMSAWLIQYTYGWHLLEIGPGWSWAPSSDALIVGATL